MLITLIFWYIYNLIKWEDLSSIPPIILDITITHNTTFIPDLLPKEAIGMDMVSIKSKSGMKPIKLLRLSAGLWKKAEFKKILRLIKWDLDCFTQLDWFLWAGVHIEQLLGLSLLKLKGLINFIPLHSKILFMITSIKDTKGILKKEITLKEPFLAWKTTAKNS